MFKKILVVMMLAVTTFTFTACDDDSESTKSAPTEKSAGSKLSTNKPNVAPDKAIEDWAMIQVYGTTGDDNEAAASTGMAPADIDKTFKDRVMSIAKDFQEEYVLNEEKATELAIHYLAKCADSSNLTVKIKKDDDINPVVTVTFSPVDDDAIVKKMRGNKEFVDFMRTIDPSDQKARKELEKNEEYQSLISQGLQEEIFDEIPVKAAKSIDMECKIFKGYDGKNYWTPEDPESLYDVIK